MNNFLVFENESLKKYCTFKIGGKAKYVYICNTNSALVSVIRHCKNKNIKFKVIGMGANILFSDNDFDGAIIVNHTKNIKFNKTNVYADSGVNVTNLIQKCYLRSLSGLENLAGIPATVGGAIVNNLGAFGCSFDECVEYVKAIDGKNPDKIIKLNKKDCDFKYRHSIFQNSSLIILKVKLNLKKDDTTLIKKRISNAVHKKVSTQPINYPSAGSVFKRGNLIPAKIIDELGLKGTRIGDAQISTKHAGFIVNLGNATSNDVKQLIKLVQTKVFENYGYVLQSEIEIID